MKWICLILRKAFIILLSISCTSTPNRVVIHTPEPPVTYNLEEKLGTQHEYRKNPLFKDATQISLYCLVHKYPEVITVVRTTDGKLEYRVRQWRR